MILTSETKTPRERPQIALPKVQLPRVHRQDQAGLPAVGQDKAGVLRGNAQGQEFFIGFVGGLSLLGEEPCGLGMGRHGGGDDDIRSGHADVALALLAEAGDAVPYLCIMMSTNDV